MFWKVSTEITKLWPSALTVSQSTRTIIDSQGIRHFFDVVRCRANELDNKPAMVAEIIGNLGLTEGVVTGDRRKDAEVAKRNSLRAMRWLWLWLGR